MMMAHGFIVTLVILLASANPRGQSVSITEEQLACGGTVTASAVQQHLEAGESYYRQGNRRGVEYRSYPEYELAAAEYSKAIALAPDCSEAFDDRANAYRNSGFFERALVDYNRAIELEAKATYFNDRGLNYALMRRYREAISDFSAALRIDPSFAKVFNNRGISREALGLYTQALSDYTSAIELVPGYAEAYNNRGILNWRLSQEHRALLDLSIAIDLSPEYGNAYRSRGLMYLLLSNHEQALLDLNRAIELEGASEDLIRMRDECLQKLRGDG